MARPAARDEQSTLDPTTVQVLSAWRVWQHTEQAVIGAEPTGWVFTDSAGKPIHPHSISQTFDRIVKRSGVPRIRLHDYADLCVMPTSAGRACEVRVIAAFGSA